MVSNQLSPVLCVVIFYGKIFSWFFVWVNFGDSQTIFGTQAERINVPVRSDLPVAIRCHLLRRKEDGKLKTVENTSLTKRKIPSWMLCGLELFPWPLLELVLIVKEVLGAVFGIFWTSLGLAQSNIFRR